MTTETPLPHLAIVKLSRCHICHLLNALRIFLLGRMDAPKSGLSLHPPRSLQVL